MIHLLTSAIIKKSSLNDLHSICKRLIESGVQRTELINEVQSTFTKLNSDDTYYDTLYDILDELTGFCKHSKSLI
jgi:hypothetical protein